MSVLTMTNVWKHSRHRGTALLMLLAIADFADDDGRAYPSVASLAAKCRMKPRNANVLLAALRDSGELEIRLGEGPKGTNLYRIKPLQSFASPAKECTPATDCPPPAKPCSKPLQSFAPKPSVNRQRRPLPPTPMVANGGNEAPMGWVEFWQAYPKKVAKDAALNAWRKLNPNEALRTKIMVALIRQTDSVQWRKDGGQFVPHPATWLNGRRWEDSQPTQHRGLVL